MAWTAATKAKFEMKKRQSARAALKAMQGYWSEYKTLPSYSELACRMNVHAKSWVSACVDRLVATGHVAKLPSGKLIQGEKFFEPVAEPNEVVAA